MDCDKIINDMKITFLTFGHQLKKNGLLTQIFVLFKKVIVSTLIWSSELKHNEQEGKEKNATEC